MATHRLARWIAAAARPKYARTGLLAASGWRLRAQIALVLLAGALLVGLAPGGARNPHPAAAAEPIPPVAVVTAVDPIQPVEVGVESSPSAATDATRTAPRRAPADNSQASDLAANGIPATALDAYQQATRRAGRLYPNCGLIWPLLAAIGRVESDHGRFAGATLHSDGLSTPPVIGIPLNGDGTAYIGDTDHGRLDGDRRYDHAVGPMQFIPSTWLGYGVDANGDGVKDPFNIYDAAAAAADYLCAAGGDLTTTDGQVRAVLAYNHSTAYVEMVLHLEAVYARGVPGISFPIPGTVPPSVTAPPNVPPVDPGKPKALPTPKPSPSSPSTSASSSATPCPTASTAPSSSTSTGPSSSTSNSPTGVATPSPSPDCSTPTTPSATTSPGSSTASASAVTPPGSATAITAAEPPTASS